MTTTFYKLVGGVGHAIDRFGPVVILFVLLCGACARQVASAAESRQEAAADIQKLFESGNEKFRAGLELAKSDRAAAEARFREAAGAWREVSRLGNIHNVKLETNIANASLLAGDVPGAILAYRRAQAIDPTNSDVLAGLAAARRSAGTEALALGQNLSKKDDVGRAGGVRGALSSIADVVKGASERATNAISSRTLLIFAAMCYVGFFAGAAIRVLGKARVPLSAIVALFVGVLICAGPLVTREIRSTHRAEAVVLATGVIARNGPAELYDPAFQEPLRAGLEVAIVESRGTWSKIRLRDGREAWVRGDAISVV